MNLEAAKLKPVMFQHWITHVNDSMKVEVWRNLLLNQIKLKITVASSVSAIEGCIVPWSLF